MRILKQSRRENATDQSNLVPRFSLLPWERGPVLVTFRATRSLSGYQVIVFEVFFSLGVLMHEAYK